MKAVLFITWIFYLIIDICYVRNIKNVKTPEDVKTSIVTIVDFILDIINIVIALFAIYLGGFLMYAFAAFLLYTGIKALVMDSRKYKNQKEKD